MGRFSDATLDAIRGRLDIVELVREYLPLKKAGRHFRGLCPFHSERTPSFMVSQEKQIFHCFGCGEGGDLFKFLIRIENSSFPEAVEDLARRAGVPVEAGGGGALSGRDKERLHLRKALELALSFYRECLKTVPEAEEARRYLDKRRIPVESQEAFWLGYAPGRGTALLEHALCKGCAPEILEKAGLVGYSAQRGRYYDYFRDRLLFPIWNSKGEVVGFGGRTLGQGEPKYLNSPETPLFSKRKILYGFFQAASFLRQERRVILLEGYTDVIACSRFGFRNAVAPLGTALTPDHVALLKRCVEEAVVVFDPDAAGAEAAVRGAELLMESEVAVRVATLSGGLDPDEFLEKEGAGAFRSLLAGAPDLAEYKATLVVAGLPPNSGLAERVKAAQAVLETISKQPNFILRSEWVRRLAERLRLDPAALEKEMARRFRKATRRPAAVEPQNASSPVPGVEAELLQFCLRHPDWIQKEPRIVETKVTDARVAKMLGALREILRAGSSNPVAALVERFPEEAGWVSGLAIEEGDAPEPAPWLERLLRSLRRSRAQTRLQELQAKKEHTDRELRELVDLGREMKGIS